MIPSGPRVPPPASTWESREDAGALRKFPHPAPTAGFPPEPAQTVVSNYLTLSYFRPHLDELMRNLLMMNYKAASFTVLVQILLLANCPHPLLWGQDRLYWTTRWAVTTARRFSQPVVEQALNCISSVFSP